jgi:aspartyl-tRNA(Asn)/glutamyl-tRNA(Gln) amidotransferase subunit B
MNIEDFPYEIVIGLEVHVQLASQSKLFCGCSTRFGSPANSQICPVCSGQPGVLPVLNRTAVAYAVRMALATNCEIRKRSRFARKNYFYPDLPKGYQVSQFDEPIAEHGSVEVYLDDTPRKIALTRIHMEEDAGKNIHLGGSQFSLVDLNRAGIPLIEIVSEPDIRSPAEAAEYMRSIRAIVRATGISDGNMEEGSLRCDANISLRQKGCETLGSRTEIKNVNSFRFVEKALEYEARRQADLLDRGERIVQETRLFDADRGVTSSMRSKEDADDYRYFPDPDLPPVLVDDEMLEAARQAVPELPIARRRRFVEQLGLSHYDAKELTKERELADYFESVLKAGAKAKPTANWMLSELLSQVDDARNLPDAIVKPQALAELLSMIEAGKISGKIAKTIWPKMWESGHSAKAIAEEENLFQQSDEKALMKEIDSILQKNDDKVQEYRGGKEKLFGFFVGQVMRATQGKANPQLVNQLLKARLDQS